MRSPPRPSTDNVLNIRRRGLEKGASLPTCVLQGKKKTEGPRIISLTKGDGINTEKIGERAPLLEAANRENSSTRYPTPKKTSVAILQGNRYGGIAWTQAPLSRTLDMDLKPGQFDPQGRAGHIKPRPPGPGCLVEGGGRGRGERQNRGVYLGEKGGTSVGVRPYCRQALSPAGKKIQGTRFQLVLRKKRGNCRPQKKDEVKGAREGSQKRND